jgi:phage recombination protein Bet
MTAQGLTRVESGGPVAQPGRALNEEQINLLKTTICAGSTDSELALFMEYAKRTGLDPFARQIHAVKRWNGDQQRETMTIQVAIDGFRLIAERSGKYEGQLGPFWCGPDGEWKEVWLSDAPPSASRVGVYKSGFRDVLWGTAHWKESVQSKKDGAPISTWAKMPGLMLAKTAEAQALRKAFPADLSGIYTPEEIGTSINEATGEVTGGGDYREGTRTSSASSASRNARAARPAPSRPDTEEQTRIALTVEAARIWAMEGYDLTAEVMSDIFGRPVEDVSTAWNDAPAPDFIRLLAFAMYQGKKFKAGEALPSPALILSDAAKFIAPE